MKEWWNDECFLFIYLPSRRMQRKREKILISCVSYSRQIPVLVLLIFATNFSTVSYRAAFYVKSKLRLFYRRMCWIDQISLTPTLRKMTTHNKDPRRENTCTNAVFFGPLRDVLEMLNGTDSDSDGEIFPS